MAKYWARRQARAPYKEAHVIFNWEGALMARQIAAAVAGCGRKVRVERHQLLQKKNVSHFHRTIPLDVHLPCCLRIRQLFDPLGPQLPWIAKAGQYWAFAGLGAEIPAAVWLR